VLCTPDRPATLPFISIRLAEDDVAPYNSYSTGGRGGGLVKLASTSSTVATEAKRSLPSSLDVSEQDVVW